MAYVLCRVAFVSLGLVLILTSATSDSAECGDGDVEKLMEVNLLQSWKLKTPTSMDPNTYSMIVLAAKLLDDAEVDYCLDIAGCCGADGVNTAGDMGVHTCKLPKNYADWQLDEIWDLDTPESGMIQWPTTPSLCLSASDVSDGATIKLEACDASSSLQRFTWNSSTQEVNLASDPSLCWAVLSTWEASGVNAANHMRELQIKRGSSVDSQYKQFLIPGSKLGEEITTTTTSTTTTATTLTTASHRRRRSSSRSRSSRSR